MKRKYLILVGAGLTLSSMMGCKDYLDRVPLDKIADETFWKTQEQLEMAATGIYSRVKAKNTIDMENMGENTMWPTTNQYKDIGSGVFPNTQPTVDNEWRNMYRDIREANAFLENYQDATENEPGANERLASEVRVIRALAYSIIVSFWGDAPLILKTLDPADPEVYGKRTPREEIVDFLLKDLEEAAVALPTEIPSGKNLGRVNKGAALALRARIALYNGRYAEAEKSAKAVMDMGVYQLYNSGDPSTSYWELFTAKGKLSRSEERRVGEGSIGG